MDRISVFPAGRYRVETILAFSHEIKNVPFMVEIYGGQTFAQARIKRRPAGGYRGYLILNHHDSLTPLEIRFHSERRVQSGRLAVVEALFFLMS